MSSVLVGMFDIHADAERARADLLSAGFSSSVVSVTGSTSSTHDTRPPGTAAIEPSLEDSPIARFFEYLFGGRNDDDLDRSAHADTYNEAFRRGSHGVTVTTANDAELDRAERILNAAGAIDIDERSQQWRKEGWSGGGAALSGGTASAEDAGVGKGTVARGGVRIFPRMTPLPVEESTRPRDSDALNRDPLSGAPGAHPVGTGVGAAAGGIAAGAAAGTVAGPAGTVVGAAVGAVAGGLAGKGVAEQVDPTVDAQGKK